jgi:DNA repair and recombination protein RAD52
MFKPEQTKALEAPLDARHVRTRRQAGRDLSYVEGWHAIKEANRIFGFGAWDRRLLDLRLLSEPYQTNGKWRVSYMAQVEITVRADGDVVVRHGCGYGSGIAQDLGDAHESAIKEAETDAMKRALMTFGNPFGLALYDKEQAEVRHLAASGADEPAAARPPRAEPARAETTKAEPAGSNARRAGRNGSERNENEGAAESAEPHMIEVPEVPEGNAAARAEAIRRMMAEAGAAPRLDEIVAAHRADLEAMPDPLKRDLRAFYAQCRRNLAPVGAK